MDFNFIADFKSVSNVIDLYHNEKIKGVGGQFDPHQTSGQKGFNKIWSNLLEFESNVFENENIILRFS